MGNPATTAMAAAGTRRAPSMNPTSAGRTAGKVERRRRATDRWTSPAAALLLLLTTATALLGGAPSAAAAAGAAATLPATDVGRAGGRSSSSVLRRRPMHREEDETPEDAADFWATFQGPPPPLPRSAVAGRALHRGDGDGVHDEGAHEELRRDNVFAHDRKFVNPRSSEHERPRSDTRSDDERTDNRPTRRSRGRGSEESSDPLSTNSTAGDALGPKSREPCRTLACCQNFTTAAAQRSCCNNDLSGYRWRKKWDNPKFPLGGVCALKACRNKGCCRRRMSDAGKSHYAGCCNRLPDRRWKLRPGKTDIADGTCVCATSRCCRRKKKAANRERCCNVQLDCHEWRRGGGSKNVLGCRKRLDYDECMAKLTDSGGGMEDPEQGGPEFRPLDWPSAVPSAMPSDAPADDPVSRGGGTTHSTTTDGNSTAAPSTAPSGAPSDVPSGAPSDAPSVVPTKATSGDIMDGNTTSGNTTDGNSTAAPLASAAPSGAPSDAPSGAPSDAPSDAPTKATSDDITDENTTSGSTTDGNLTAAPSTAPSGAPSDTPSGAPSDAPSDAPTKATSGDITDGNTTSGNTANGNSTAAPSTVPSGAPNDAPSGAPSDVPSDAPTKAISDNTTDGNTTSGNTADGNSTAAPSAAPSGAPSDATTKAISENTTDRNSTSSNTADGNSTAAPSAAPSGGPSDVPSGAPSDAPSDTPTKAMGSGAPVPARADLGENSSTNTTATCANETDCGGSVCALPSYAGRDGPAICCPSGSSSSLVLPGDGGVQIQVCTEQEEGAVCGTLGVKNDLLCRGACSRGSWGVDDGMLVCCSDGGGSAKAPSPGGNSLSYCADMPNGVACGSDGMCASGLCDSAMCVEQPSVAPSAAPSAMPSSSAMPSAAPTSSAMPSSTPSSAPTLPLGRRPCSNETDCGPAPAACAYAGLSDAAGGAGTVCCATGASLMTVFGGSPVRVCTGQPDGAGCGSTGTGNDQLCLSGSCHVGEWAAGALAVCCPAGTAVEPPLLLSPDNATYLTYCAGAPRGTACGSDDMCASGKCADNECAGPETSDGPSGRPSLPPSSSPSGQPSSAPSGQPSLAPSSAPTKEPMSAASAQGGNGTSVVVLDVSSGD